MLAGFISLVWIATSLAFAGFGPALACASVLALVWLCMLAHAYHCGDPADASVSRPWIAALCSTIWPGLGQLCSFQIWRGCGFLTAAALALLLPWELSVVILAALRIAAAVTAFQSVGRRFAAELGHTKFLIAAIGGRLFLTLIVSFGICTFWIQPFSVPTGAMAPTILGNRVEAGEREMGDHLFVDKLAYRFHSPQRGDVVVFRTRGINGLDQDAFYVKRVVGLPGERVSIRPPFLLINGAKVTEPGVFEKIQSQRGGFVGFQLARTRYPGGPVLQAETDDIELGEGKYLVLGDNQHNSLDSRYWGPVHRDSIIGKVTKIYWPPARTGTVME